MSEFRLPRLPNNVPLVEKSGSVTLIFQRWWQSVVQKIEAQELSQDAILAALQVLTEELSAAVADIIAAQAAADAAAAAAADATADAAEKIPLTDIGVTVQPYDADLAAIAALTTTTFGRDLLTQADAAATRAAIGAGTSSATGTVTSVAALTLGTAGTDLSSTVANSATTPVITLNVPNASATNRGALLAADWSTFNAKQPAGAYLTANQSITYTGDVSGSGTTAVTLTIGANKVTLAQMAQVATARFLGRTTAATGDVEALTATQATAMLNAATTSLQGMLSAADKTKLDAILAWAAWTPTIASEAGALGTVTLNTGETRYQRVNNTVTADVSFQVVSVGTASGGFIISTPVTPAAGVTVIAHDLSNTRILSGGKSGAASARVARIDGGTAAVAGAYYYFTFIYEIA